MIILYVGTYLYLGFLFATSNDYKKKDVLDYINFFLIIIFFPFILTTLSWIALIKTIKKAANE